MARQAGLHFLQIPGPTNVPERVIRAISRPMIDHRGPEFARIARTVLRGLAELVHTDDPVALYASSGTGAWEAALVNSLSPGDTVLLCENGFFAQRWGTLAESIGLQVVTISGDWRHGPDPTEIGSVLTDDRERRISAVLLVHNETSTGVVSRIPEIREAIDRSRHPTLLLVDTISSLGTMEYQHDEWGVDVTISCSQKGLMLPPGLGINIVSEKALRASESAASRKGYWEWQPTLAAGLTGFFPSTPATTLVRGLQEALEMLQEEGLPDVFARHARHARATRCAIEAWQMEVFSADPREYSNSLSAALVPEGHDADVLREWLRDELNLSLGAGLGPLAGKVFRIGHLGDFNDLMLMGALSGVELGLERCNFPSRGRGIAAALEELKRSPSQRASAVDQTDRANSGAASGSLDR